MILTVKMQMKERDLHHWYELLCIKEILLSKPYSNDFHIGMDIEYLTLFFVFHVYLLYLRVFTYNSKSYI